jgi:energy-coupling factor transporter ATP-binding protein EcfA2
MPDAMNTRRVSSPASTGGAGTIFEQHVGAYLLAQLLVRGIPPILHDCTVAEVHFQTEHFGWHTDDFLVIGQNGSGSQRKLAVQVKRTFSVSATDEECKKAVQDFWRDFGNAAQFSSATDRLALITLRGTNTLLEHFSGLLDCSRAARDGVEFENRLSTPGFISKKAVSYCDELRTIIGEVEGRSVTAADIWPFLRVLYVLSLDLHSATRQTESMIKTLLAYTAGEPGTGIAQASWDNLLSVAGDAMPEARSFRHDDLPESLRQRHSFLSGTEQQALRSLHDHTSLILHGIHSTIGSDLHLQRAGLVQQVIDELESSQVVLISGHAGSGKSTVAKDVISILSTDYFAFSFRAEEFAQPHFDATLQNSQIPANATTLEAILASQDRKLLLIESVERLLEKSTRDAFTDLLTLAEKDKTLRIILTCRDYSTDLVRACFLKTIQVAHSVITVPELDDEELAEVEAAHPTLGSPLSNTALRHILRNPYILDKALQISWSAERSLPESERDFRALFWQQIVRAEHRLGGGMPRLREEAFVQIALQRARALTVYVPYNDLDPAVVDALRHDSLIVSPEQSSILVATAHDVLEDWAILHWIEEQHVIHEGPFKELFTIIDTHPAVRRAYRKWVAEMVDSDPGAADRLFQAAVIEVDVPSQFRDDTLISLLRAPSSDAFLERHEAELFAGNKDLLRRVIHLLRVACVTMPEWLTKSAGQGSALNIPDGPAWGCVLRLVAGHLTEFLPQDCLLLLGLIEDWSRGISWRTAYPDGAVAATAIAHWLLPKFDNYRSEDQRKRTMRVIAKIPNADRERFEILIRGSVEKNWQDRTTEDFRGIIFAGIEGTPTARDLPDLFISAANDYLLCSEEELREDRQYLGSLMLETLFGIKEGLRHDFFPASAYRGPLCPLLRYHPRKGIDFIIAVFNHSAEWYAHPRVWMEHVEPPFEIELTFADGTSQKQWCNARLWNWYRGSSVGPYVLQSLLMALERWLLEFAQRNPNELDAVLLNILRRSDSSALTAVVASVATAFPHESGETLLVLLRSPMCILLDRRRMASERQASSNILGLMPRLRAEDSIYEVERKDADARPHRWHDLENAIANLQLGPLAASVHEILDQHRAALPPVSEQDEGNRVWRLAIHKMDLRQYTFTYGVEENATAIDKITSPGPEQRYIHLELKEPEPDIKEMVERSAAKTDIMNSRLGLLMWGIEVFKHEDGQTYDSTQWRQYLEQVRSADATSFQDGELDAAHNGPGFVAAVCVRDHWDEMSEDERGRAITLICSEVTRQANVWNHLARMQRFEMSADRPCAWVLPLLLGKSLTEAQQTKVYEAFVTGLTHAIDEVRWYTTWGVAKQLWSIDINLTLRCVNAIAMEATLVEQARDVEKERPYPERRQLDDIEAEAALTIRRRFWDAGPITDDAYEALDVSEWFGAEANERILAILSQMPNEPAAIAGFRRTAETLVAWWDDDDNRDKEQRERNHEAESTLSELLQNFVLRTSNVVTELILKPILDAVDRHPREIHWFVRGLITIQDREPNTQHFWFVWRLFADSVQQAEWLAQLDNEYPTGDEMISAIFLGSWWKEEIRHWQSLEGYAYHIHDLFDSLPPSSTVLDDYVRFLYHIGEQSLPAAFIRIAGRLRLGDPNQMLRKTNTVFLLEVLLQRYVYGRPLELKRERTLRDAVLFLLDLLVEQGSSAAFQMRDDFVTPISL